MSRPYIKKVKIEWPQKPAAVPDDNRKITYNVVAFLENSL